VLDLYSASSLKQQSAKVYQRYVHVHMCVSEIYQCLIKYAINRIGGVKVSVLASFEVIRHLVYLQMQLIKSVQYLLLRVMG
jgi:hypothetical protein